MKVCIGKITSFLYLIAYQVYLPVISGHLPRQMVQAIRALLEFCYIARQEVHTQTTIDNLTDALARFHRLREIFSTSGVRKDGFNLPRQHSLKHWAKMIWDFGAPSGLCTSIIESKHIPAVKKPWRRSSHNQPLDQMLTTNQRMDKLAALRSKCQEQGLWHGTALEAALKELGKSLVKIIIFVPH